MALKKLRVTGGPHGKNMKLILDGEEVTNAYKFDLQTAVDDAVRMQIGYVVIEMEDMELEGVVEHVVYLKRRSSVMDYERSPEGNLELAITAIEQRGESLPDALRKLADKIEAEAGPVH